MIPINSIKFSTVILLAVLFAFCSNKKEGTVKIEGSLPAMAGDTIFLEELDVKQIHFLHKMVIRENGYFSFKINLHDAGFYILRAKGPRMVILLLERGENVRLVSKSKDFHLDYDVFQSKGSSLLRDFDFFMNRQKARVDSLHQVFLQVQYTPGFAERQEELDSVYNLILENQVRYVKNFIDRNPSSLASLIVINRKFGRREVLNKVDDLEYFKKLDDSLMKAWPGNKHVLDNHKLMEELTKTAKKELEARNRIAVGKTAPDIALKDTSGQTVRLSSLKNKKVLLYFWAGWNSRSRQDNIRLQSIYNKRNRSEFEIYAVSFDNHENVWEGAIRLDKLKWINVSDLKGVSSPINELYNLKGQLPHFFLLDKNNIIIEKAIFLDSLKTINM